MQSTSLLRPSFSLNQAAHRIKSLKCRSVVTTQQVIQLPVGQLTVDEDGRVHIDDVMAVLRQQTQQAPPKAPPAAPAPAAKPASWDSQLKMGWSDVRKQGGNVIAHVCQVAQTKIQKTLANTLASDVMWSALAMFTLFLILGTASAHVASLPGVGAWHSKGLSLLIGSFGTLSVLLFSRPESEPVRFWNLIVGHVTSICVVLAVLAVMGPGIVSRALAMSLALAAMMITDSIHPPGGALIMLAEDSAVIQTQIQGWFLVYPSLVWTIALLLPLGVAVNWLKRTFRFDWQGRPVTKPTSSGAHNGSNGRTVNGNGKNGHGSDGWTYNGSNLKMA